MKEGAEVHRFFSSPNNDGQVQKDKPLMACEKHWQDRKTSWTHSASTTLQSAALDIRKAVMKNVKIAPTWTC